MRFLDPEWLWCLLALPLLGLLGAWSARRRRLALARFAGGGKYRDRFEREISRNKRAAKMLLLYLAWAALVIAAARPQWGTRLEQIERKGIDVVIALDTSLSMAAEDAPPSRLDQARSQIDGLLRGLEGNRAALVTFAGQATLSCPLTLDHAAVRLFLETVGPEAVQVPGTALADALKLAVRTFGERRAGEEDRGRAVVLFSDGEDHEGGLEEILGDLRSAGIGVYAVGNGTRRGAPIPVLEADGSAGYKKDREGKVVTTRLDETVLQQLALETEGQYHRATAEGKEIARIAQALTALDAREYGAVLRARYEERFQIPLALALVALLAESVLGDRRRGRAARPVQEAGS